jgi:hypothetical protein
VAVSGEQMGEGEKVGVLGDQVVALGIQIGIETDGLLFDNIYLYDLW